MLLQSQIDSDLSHKMGCLEHNFGIRNGFAFVIINIFKSLYYISYVNESLEIYHGKAHDSAKCENCSFSKWRNLALWTDILATMIT
jgi:hypothetical protein